MSTPARIDTAGGLSVIDTERFSAMEQVARMRMEGQNDTDIAKKLGITRKEVKSLHEDYKDVIAKDAMSRDTARDYLNQMVAHFDKLIKEYYQLYEDLQNEPFSHQMAGQINAALKMIAQLESDRVKHLRDYGLLEAADLGDELAEREEKEAMIVDILRHHLCNDCKAEVARRLSVITGNVEAVQVEDE